MQISGKESLVHTGAGSEKTEKEKYVYHVYETTSKVAFEIPHYLGEPCTEKWSRFQANYTRTYDQNVLVFQHDSRICQTSYFTCC